LRKLVSQAFTRRRVEALRPAIQQHADTLIGQILEARAASGAETGYTDLISSYAVPLPLAVIGDLFAVPREHLHDFRDWTSVLLAPEPGQAANAKQAVGNMVRFLVQLITVRRTDPGDDLLSAMISARDDHDRLNEDELISLAFLILWAGYENSVHLIGNSILALLQHPEQAQLLIQQALADQPDQPDQQGLPDRSVNELLRFADPNQYAIRRFPTEDITINGTLIPAGDTVLLVLASANRDPAHYVNPDTLDLARSSNPHLSFGAGLHHCLGAPLARLETDIAIGTLLRGLPDLALAVPTGDLTWRPSFRSRGLHQLPVTFTPLF